MLEAMSEQDLAVVREQLGRAPRDLLGVAHRCPCGSPDVVATSPRLSDGSPFPTFCYLTCPSAVSAIGTLEASGVMSEMTERVSRDPELQVRYQHAHDSYLADRRSHGEVAEIARTSAGGMPTRVKCLHALVAHSLAAGPGLNPFGDESLALLPRWWAAGPCTRAGGRLAEAAGS